MILITAFEPFDGTGMNASQEVLNEFLRRHYGSLPVASAILPVEYEQDVERAWQVIEQCQPRAVLHLGQTGAKTILVERIGINFKRSHAGGDQTIILADAPPAYLTTIPVDEIVSALREARLPAEGSAHAGTYLCNHILYRSLHEAATRGLTLPIGFLHLPRLPEQAGKLGQGTPALSLETMVQAVEIAVRVLLQVK